MKARFLSLILLALPCLTSQSEVEPLRILNIDIIPVSCTDGPTTATVTFNVVGGTPSYLYFLNGASQPENVFSGLPAELHSFTIVDAVGTQITAEINVGPSAYTNVFVGQAPYCEDRYNQGVITVITEGGVEPLTQTLEPTSQTIEGEGGNFDPVEADNYTVTSSDSSEAPCGSVTINFDLIIPQESGNIITDFVNKKYCIPCES